MTFIHAIMKINEDRSSLQAISGTRAYSLDPCSGTRKMSNKTYNLVKLKLTHLYVLTTIYYNIRLYNMLNLFRFIRMLGMYIIISSRYVDQKRFSFVSCLCNRINFAFKYYRGATSRFRVNS